MISLLPSTNFRVMIIQRWAASVLQFFNVITLSPWDRSDSPAQQVLEIVDVASNEHSPIFQPPNGSPDLPFSCNYTAMGPGWANCSTSGDRTCWLRGPKGAKYDINTDYEKDWPAGQLRKVWYTLLLSTSIFLYHLKTNGTESRASITSISQKPSWRQMEL